MNGKLLQEALIEIASAIDIIEVAERDAQDAASGGRIDEDRVYSWLLLDASEGLEKAKELIGKALKELQC